MLTFRVRPRSGSARRCRRDLAKQRLRSWHDCCSSNRGPLIGCPSMLDQIPGAGEVAGGDIPVGDAGAAARHVPYPARRRFYVPLRFKFFLTLAFALTWMGVSIWLSLPWLRELGAVFGPVLALVSIAFIAYVPGFMNAFLMASILGDRRPQRRFVCDYPDLCVLVAC